MLCQASECFRAHLRRQCLRDARSLRHRSRPKQKMMTHLGILCVQFSDTSCGFAFSSASRSQSVPFRFTQLKQQLYKTRAKKAVVFASQPDSQPDSLSINNNSGLPSHQQPTLSVGSHYCRQLSKKELDKTLVALFYLIFHGKLES